MFKMREIKFRLWDKEKKVMIPNNGDDYEEEYCYLVMFIGGSLALCWSQDDDVFFKDVSDKYEIMQFTGLKDSKGKEIYEGDIVIADDGGEWFPHEYDEEKDEYYPTGKYLVEYDSEFARFILIDPKTNCEAECDYNPFSLPDFTLEVIGNKFQNPELLKEVENAQT